MITLTDSLLQDAVGDVLTGLLGDALDDHAAATVPTYVASVTLGGEFEGLLAVRCTDDTARRLAAIMFDQAPDELDAADVADAMGEVANQVGGVVKTLVPSPTQLGLPVVVRGTRIGADADLALLSSASLDREEGRVDVFLFAAPV
ncbi:MAG: chemotaxis protein CheX [Microthrixaceae bacterium]